MASLTHYLQEKRNISVWNLYLPIAVVFTIFNLSFSKGWSMFVLVPFCIFFAPVFFALHFLVYRCLNMQFRLSLSLLAIFNSLLLLLIFLLIPGVDDSETVHYFLVIGISRDSSLSAIFSSLLAGSVVVWIVSCVFMLVFSASCYLEYRRKRQKPEAEVTPIAVSQQSYPEQTEPVNETTTKDI